jgi:hypothetical protein
LQFSAEKVLKNNFFSTNSTEFSAENHFPQKMSKKSAPDGFSIHTKYSRG